MSRRVRWLLPVLVVGAVLLVWQACSATPHEAWLERLSALEAAGEPLRPEDFRGEPVPEAENAEGPLRVTYEAYHHIWPDWPSPTMYPMQEEGPDLTEDERDEIDVWWRKLAPLYEPLEDASRRPVFVSTAEDPLGLRLIPWFQHAGRMWALRAEYRPSEAAEMGLQNLRLARAHEPRNHLEATVRWGHVHHAIRILHRAQVLDPGSFVEAGPEVDALLREIEPTLWADARLAVQSRRAYLIRYVDWCTDAGPLPKDWPGWHEMVEEGRAQPRRWLYGDGLDELDRFVAVARSVASEEALRTHPRVPSSEHPAAQELYSIRGALLRTLATLRLARWAVRLETEWQAKRELRDDLLGYADLFPDGMPVDPYTGLGFRWEAHGASWLLAVDASGLDPDLREVGFYWDVPDEGDEALVEQELAWRFGPTPAWSDSAADD